MRRLRHTLVLLGSAIALLAPALALAADEQPQAAGAADPPELTAGNVSPNAALSIALDGESVSFDASGSSDPDGALELFEWDLDGDGVYEESSGTQAVLERELPAGTTLVAGVRVRDDDGAADETTASVAVPAAAEPDEPLAPAASQPQLVDQAELPEPAPRQAEPTKPRKRRQRTVAARLDEPTVRAAASRAVTISDFDFGPATVNVSVGDTVTWTNRGPTLHTATANDGSFDSGNLDRGERYSKSFSSAGTFSYICKPHPFMTGRVVVAAAGDDSGGGSGGGGSTGSGGSSGDGRSTGSGDDAAAADAGAADDSAGGLADTGADLIPWSLFGLSLLAFGAAMRLRLSVD